MERQGPKWAKPDRQAHLLRLWSRHGNKCLQGHTACPHPQHYVHERPQAVTVAKAVKVRCQDRQGNPIVDRQGKPLFVTMYKPVKAIVPETIVCRLYDLLSEQVIAEWVADDRAQRQAQAQAEQRELHRLPERGPLRGQFSAIGRAIFFDCQPEYYLDSLGISGLTFRPFAKVRIASSPVHLYVDLGDTLRGMSKAKRRKAIRYGKALPEQVKVDVDLACRLAVRHYLR